MPYKCAANNLKIAHDSVICVCTSTQWPSSRIRQRVRIATTYHKPYISKTTLHAFVSFMLHFALHVLQISHWYRGIKVNYFLNDIRVAKDATILLKMRNVTSRHSRQREWEWVRRWHKMILNIYAHRSLRMVHKWLLNAVLIKNELISWHTRHNSFVFVPKKMIQLRNLCVSHVWDRIVACVAKQNIRRQYVNWKKKWQNHSEHAGRSPTIILFVLRSDTNQRI